MKILKFTTKSFSFRLGSVLLCPLSQACQPIKAGGLGSVLFSIPSQAQLL
jgi:hypothetical protein